MSSLIIPKLLPICILLSLVLAIINWVLSFIQIKLPYSIFKFFEILLTLVIAFTITITLIDYHVVINREHFSPTAYIPFGLCLFAVQTYYAQQYYKISYVFITNFVTLLLTLILFYFVPYKILSLPIFLYYVVHTIVLLIGGFHDNTHENTIALLRKQIWINDSKLLNAILPKKNISTCLLSCVASFCYSSLNLCILVSLKETGILVYTALCFTCMLLLLTAIISFSLLVKYDDVGNECFPGCLLIHYIMQAYKRCENLIIYEQNKKTYTIFTLRSALFAILLIVDALGSTSYAMTVTEGEALGESTLGNAIRRTFSWPNIGSAAGGLGTGLASTYLYDQATSAPGEDPQVTIARLEEQLKGKDEIIIEKDKQIQLLKERSCWSVFSCFKKNP